MPFKKIEIKKKSSYVADQIIESIQKGIYKVGDKLPPEKQIVKETGVSRPSVRTALLALQIVGIVEGRAGAGTYVKQKVGTTQRKFEVLSMLEGSEGLFEVLEALKALEEGVVKLAAKKATPNDVEKIKESLELVHKATESRNYEQFEKADRDFHMAIIKSCKSSLIEAALCPFVDIVGQKLWKKMKRYSLNEEQMTETIKEHQRIFDALRDKDEELMSKEMVEHLAKSEKRFLGISEKSSQKEVK